MAADPPRAPGADPGAADDDRWLDLEIKLAYQERLIRELDGLCRELADRVAQAERELRAVKAALPAPVPVGPANERPPHY